MRENWDEDEVERMLLWQGGAQWLTVLRRSASLIRYKVGIKLLTRFSSDIKFRVSSTPLYLSSMDEFRMYTRYYIAQRENGPQNCEH